MAVKNIESNEVHKGYKGGYTGCGVNTNENPKHWGMSLQRITCDKNGCKN